MRKSAVSLRKNYYHFFTPRFSRTVGDTHPQMQSVTAPEKQQKTSSYHKSQPPKKATTYLDHRQPKHEMFTVVHYDRDRPDNGHDHRDQLYKAATAAVDDDVVPPAKSKNSREPPSTVDYGLPDYSSGKYSDEKKHPPPKPQTYFPKSSYSPAETDYVSCKSPYMEPNKRVNIAYINPKLSCWREESSAASIKVEYEEEMRDFEKVQEAGMMGAV